MKKYRLLTMIMAFVMLMPSTAYVYADPTETDNTGNEFAETNPGDDGQEGGSEASAATVTPTPVPVPADDPEEQIRAFCVRLYDYCLDREPDEYGISDWTAKLINNEISGADCGYGFVFSPEYLSKKTSNRNYIEMLYKVFLDRPSDPNGMQYWLNKFEEGHSREYVFSGFVNSDEYTIICSNYGIERGDYESNVPRDVNIGVTQFVQRLYLKALLRKGEDKGINDWCQMINSGKMTFEEVAESFVNSEEFLTYDYNDEDYLKILYSIFLDREADKYGLDHWLEYLESGKTRDDVLPMFSYSAEFTEIIESFGFEIKQIKPVTGGSNIWADVQHNANKLPKIQEAQTAILARAEQLRVDGIKYDFGAKIPENGALDCSGYVTDVFRRSLGTMGVTGTYVTGSTDGDGGRGHYYNQFSGFQSLAFQGTWSYSSSAEGTYNTYSWAGTAFIDKFGIGSPDIMDVSQWKRYLDRLGVSYDYVRYSESMGSAPIRLNDEGKVLNWGSWEFLANCHPGDIVIWPDANEVCSTGNEWNHIGIYAGDGQVYHCSSCNYSLPDQPTDYVGVQLSVLSDVRGGFQERGVGGVYIYHVFSE